jgi:hypothetical protein
MINDPTPEARRIGDVLSELSERGFVVRSPADSAAGPGEQDSGERGGKRDSAASARDMLGICNRAEAKRDKPADDEVTDHASTSAVARS